LSAPAQVLGWSDKSLKWPKMCWAGRRTLLTQASKTNSHWVTDVRKQTQPTRSTEIIRPCISVLCKCCMHLDASSVDAIMTKP